MGGEGVLVVMFEVRRVMVVIMIRMAIVMSVPGMRRIRVFRCGRINHPDRCFRSWLSAQSGVFLITVVILVIMLLVVMLIMVMVIMVMIMILVTMAFVVMAFVVMAFVGVVMVLVTVEIVKRMHSFATIERVFDQLRPGRMLSSCFIGLGQLMLGSVVADRCFCGQWPIGVRSFHNVTLDPLAMTAATRAAMSRAPAAGPVLVLFFRLAMRALFGLDQGLTIRHRNLVVVWMDFAEGKKPVAVAAIFDEGGLQGRLYPRDLGEVDVAAQLLALGGLEIKLFDAVATDHNDPGLFRVGGIDQHFVWHF
jgi:hypothetical protein